MINVADVVAELDGNGFNQRELLEISAKLTELAVIRERIVEELSVFYDDDELTDIFGTLKKPSTDQQLLSKLLRESLSKREKQCYLMHTVDNKSMGNIAIELGVSKGAVQQSIERARKKIERIEEEI